MGGQFKLMLPIIHTNGKFQRRHDVRKCPRGGKCIEVIKRGFQKDKLTQTSDFGAVLLYNEFQIHLLEVL